MIADDVCDGSEDSFEMEEVSETTRLMSKQDAESMSPEKASSNSSVYHSSQRSMASKIDVPHSYTNTAADVNEQALSVNRLPCDGTASNASNSSRGDGQNHGEQKTTVYVVLLAAFAAIGGFLFGYDTGVVSGAMLLLRDEFSLSSLDQELVVSVTIGGAFVAALAGGYVSDMFGRKACTMAASVVFTAGALVLGFAENVTMLIIGRLILGFGIGNLF